MERIEGLGGAFAVTVTPTTDRGAPDYGELRRQTAWLCGQDIAGLFPCSSTGEFIKFEAAERSRILQTVAEENAGRKRLIAGACGAGAREVLQGVETAARCAYDACVVCPPYYYPQSQEDILRFYTRIAAEAGGMKIILYHVPFFTTGLELSTIQSLAQVDSIIGIKDSSANMKHIAHTVQMTPERFRVYTGTDDCLLPSLAAGCAGSMTALAGILPEWIASVYREWERGNITEARKKQNAVLPLLRIADSLSFPAGYKLAAEARGLEIGPLPVASERIAETRRAIRDELAKLSREGFIDESNGMGGR